MSEHEVMAMAQRDYDNRTDSRIRCPVCMGEKFHVMPTEDGAWVEVECIRCDGTGEVEG